MFIAWLSDYTFVCIILGSQFMLGCQHNWQYQLKHTAGKYGRLQAKACNFYNLLNSKQRLIGSEMHIWIQRTVQKAIVSALSLS